jgi:hypothetical protein
MEREWMPSERFWRDGLSVVLDALWIAPLAASMAALGWALLSPLPAFAPAPSAPAPITPLVAGVDPFFGQAPVDAAPASPSGFTLQAVRTGGSAILTPPGGAQTLVFVGEEAAPGWRLVEAGVDHVVLEGPGGRVTVPFPASDLIRPERNQETPGSPGGDGGGVQLTPSETVSGSPGMRLSAPAGTGLLAAMGLREGDVITRIGPLDASEITTSDIQAALLSERPVEVRFERDGRAMITHTGKGGR